jgi:hypothetical protein
MKKFNGCKGLLITVMLLCTVNAGAQKAASIDLAYIRNIRHQLNGLNVSSFYHFNERLIGGI